jgi:hypothetical protein
MDELLIEFPELFDHGRLLLPGEVIHAGNEELLVLLGYVLRIDPNQRLKGSLDPIAVMVA